MRVDERIEEIVREAYRAVIAKDGDRLVSTFRGLEEEDARKAVAYGIFVCGYIVNDVFRDGAKEQELRELATKIIASEADWVDVGSPDEVAGVLGAAAKGESPFGNVPPQDAIGTVFVCGGFMLTSFRLKREHWWDYLDEIWAAAESMPERS
jgi:hypothetical protein